MKTIEHQEFLAMRRGAEVLEADGHGDKVLRLVDGSMLKLFRRKRLITSAAWYPYAQRFVDNADALRERGVHVPCIIAAMRIPSSSAPAGISPISFAVSSPTLGATRTTRTPRWRIFDSSREWSI